MKEGVDTTSCRVSTLAPWLPDSLAVIFIQQVPRWLCIGPLLPGTYPVPRSRPGLQGLPTDAGCHAAIDCVASVFPFTSTARKRMLLPVARGNGPA
jgi:hypothetical protein